jgi:hypothetical protein
MALMGIKRCAQLSDARPEFVIASKQELTSIPVGTQVTLRPRTAPSMRYERTLLPPRVFDEEATLRPGMADPGWAIVRSALYL